MKQALLILFLLGSIIMLMLLSKQQEELQERTVPIPSREQLPPGAIGKLENGGYLYPKDFIGPLNKYDQRQEQEDQTSR